MYLFIVYICDKWVPVTTAWCVPLLRMEERPPVRRVAANILNKQSRTADKGWSSSLGVGRSVYNSPTLEPTLSRIMNTCLEPGLILCYDLSNERGTWIGSSWLMIETGGVQL